MQVARGSWPSSIPTEALRVYRQTLDLLTAEFADSSVFSEPFLNLLDTPLEVEPLRASPHKIAAREKQLLEERGLKDPLFRSFREWAAAELAPRKRPALTLTRRRRLRVMSKWEHRRYLLAVSLKEIASLVAYRWTPRELVVLATQGDRKSFFRLVELDKVFLTARFSKGWIVSAQSWQKEKKKTFFKRLLGSMCRDTLTEVMPSAKLGIACYLLWFLGFEQEGKKRLLDFLESEGLAWYPDPNSFYKHLSRLGIKSRAKEVDKNMP
jgi:hypothetical protein